MSVLVAVFYRDIDLVAKKAGRKQYFIVTRWTSKMKVFSIWKCIEMLSFAFRVFSIGRFLTTLLYWKGMFDMLDSFSEWWVSISPFSSFGSLLLAFFFHFYLSMQRSGLCLSSRSPSPPAFSSSLELSRVPPSHLRWLSPSWYFSWGWWRWWRWS